MPDTYELRLYDNVLMTFSLEQKGIEGLVAGLGMVDHTRSALLPLDMDITPEGVVAWLKRRVIPKNRAFVDEILKTLGLSVNDTKGIIDVCKGLSLNDSYWVVPQGFPGTFAQHNLFENRFSEILSLVAYTGAGGSKAAFTTSPELTTNGMLPKAWRYIEGEGVCLYKGGTSGASNTGNEPYSEFYASQVARAMGLDAVQYDLEQWKGVLASKCALFTSIDTAYVPIGRIVRSGGLKACLEYYRSLSDEAYERVCSMLVFDAVIYNEDRHFGNFGVLRSSRTGEVLGAAPIFDNGLSLFNFATKSDLEDLDAYAMTRSTPYDGISFETVCKQVMGKQQLSQLRRLIGFRFVRHPHYNLPDPRLEAIEVHLQKRVRQLLTLL